MTIHIGAWILRATAIARSDADAIASTDMTATVAETPVTAASQAAGTESVPVAPLISQASSACSPRG